MSGYPDFQVYTNRRTSNLLAASTQTLAPGHNVTSVLKAGTYSGISLRILPSAGAAKVTVSWYLDSAGTMLLHSDIWPVNTGTGLNVIYPVRSDFMTIDIDVTSAGNLTASTFMAGLGTAPANISYPVVAPFTSISARVLPAGGKDLYHLPWLARGPATITVAPYDTAGKLQAAVIQLDELGNFLRPLGTLGNPVSPLVSNIYLPDVMAVLQITNQDGAASHEYDASYIIVSE